MSLTRRSLILASVLAGTTSLAWAAPATRVRGTISSVGHDSFVVKTRTGNDRTIKLGDKVAYGWVVPISLDAVKPGAFIGTAAINQPDGTLKALEIHVFPEAMRGAGEGHRSWDRGENSSMTNGTIGSVTSSNGRTLRVTYHGGEKTVEIPPGTPIVTFESATMGTVLKPGEHVIVTGSEAADGAVVATSVRAGKDGLVPPM